MNFGERLKQLRTGQGLTQPQLAQMAGIEQSYLSKLENDKSVPSAEMFSTIVSALKMDAASFLQDIDQDLQVTSLRHIPAVSQATQQAALARARQARRWVVGAALAWLIGFAMMLAANDGIFFSNKLYKYNSAGVIHVNEADKVFQAHKEILELRVAAKLITPEDAAGELAQFQASRLAPVTLEWRESRGSAYVEPAENGRRRFELVGTEYAKAPGNRILHYLGALVFACGFAALFIEWRLRRMKHLSN
jgi:transcriptional regulator with XRE-family HTH domain